MQKGWAAWPRSARWLTATFAVVLLVFVVTWALFVPTADWLAHHDVGSAVGPLHETALDNARGRLLTLGAGLFAAGALAFTAQNFVLSRRTVELSRRTFELTEQGQVTDRYTKAIEQLGSDKLDVRLGGIYALERIARDSARDHSTVMEVLTAFIREHSHEQWPPPDHPASQGRERSTRPDVQAALTVVGRRDPDRDSLSIDLRDAILTHADLRGAILTGADLLTADLGDATLTGANLARANLRGAILPAADLTRTELIAADFSDANLAYSDLRHANLTGANLSRADLTHANLFGPNLTSAILFRANLTDANLSGAKLTNLTLVSADLTRADLTRAILVTALLNDAVLDGAMLDLAVWPSGEPLPPGWERGPDAGLKRSRAGSAPAERD